MSFFKISSVRGIEVLIAAEFQQRLNYWGFILIGTVHTHAKRGFIALIAHSLVEQAHKLWGNGLGRIDSVLGWRGYIIWSFVVSSSPIFQVYVTGRDFYSA